MHHIFCFAAKFSFFKLLYEEASEILQQISKSNKIVGEISLDGQGFGPDYIKNRLDPYSSKEHIIIKETFQLHRDIFYNAS